MLTPRGAFPNTARRLLGLVGGVAERSTAADCKSADFGLRRFESFPLHHMLARCWRV